MGNFEDKNLNLFCIYRDKRIMTPASNASSLPSSSESPVWKNQMSQQEFNSNNSEGFYK